MYLSKPKSNSCINIALYCNHLEIIFYQALPLSNHPKFPRTLAFPRLSAWLRGWFFYIKYRNHVFVSCQQKIYCPFPVGDLNYFC